MTDTWPKPLVDARGPFRSDKLDGAAQGMGRWGAQTRALAAEGIVPPDMMTGLTLFILSNQPRDPAKQQTIPGGGGGVAGGVWVRERFTIYRPLTREEVFTVSGTSVGRHVHKGRRYGTNMSTTRNLEGEKVAANLTTGLLQYKVDADLADKVEGQSPDSIEAPAPGWENASSNPCRAALAQLEPGAEFAGEAVTVSLAMMAARDTARPDNPIHSDPELARKAGLSRPIAGGSHVLSFALEPIMQGLGELGRYALLHGTAFDIRWKAPVYADLTVFPKATVTMVARDRVMIDVGVALESGELAMTGQLTVPLA